MTTEQFDAIIERLDAIVKLLEMQTLVPDDAPGCPHERARDMGVMGDKPGEHMKCLDCGATFSRIGDNAND